MFEGLGIIGFLKKGGVTVIVLAILSVISLAVILERAWTFNRFRKGLYRFYGALLKAVKDGGIRDAIELCKDHSSPLAPVILAGYSRREKGREEVLRAMELSARLELSGLERNLGILGTIGSTSPFIGLFGTVLGIIRAFSDLSIAEGALPSAVTEGIAEALVATAAGLFVAVPAVMAYNYFVRLLQRRSLELETRANEFVDLITGDEKDGMESQG